ncbi:MAG: 50S ribosomal protein L20 [bacterium]|nr:50S ribosomal protein L20 [bacterium]
MPRVKRSVMHLKKRRSLMKAAKGYRWGRKNIIRLARPAVLKAGAYAFRDRRAKKRDFRALWLMKINAAARLHGLSYSVFMAKAKAAKLGLDRKILAQLAEHHPKVFAKIVETIKG